MQFTPSLYRGFMLKHFQSARRLRKTVAHSPEEFFGFSIPRTSRSFISTFKASVRGLGFA